jgi:hypothetical protein
MVRLCTYWDLKRELIPWIGGRKVGTHRRGRRFVPADFLPRRFAHIRFGRAEGFSLAVWLGGPTCVVRTTLRVGPLPSATTQKIRKRPGQSKAGQRPETTPREKGRSSLVPRLPPRYGSRSA